MATAAFTRESLRLGADLSMSSGVHQRPPIAQFLAAHENVTQLLRVFEAELERIRIDDSPDYELSLSVLQYVTRFTDRYHHPAEDLAMRILLEREPALTQSIAGLASEHRALLATGQRLLTVLEDVISDATMSRDTLCAQGICYVDGLRSHMQHEEHAVFPLMATRLTPEDFERIEREVGREEDPLFGKIVSDRFEALQRELALLA